MHRRAGAPPLIEERAERRLRAAQREQERLRKALADRDIELQTGQQRINELTARVQSLEEQISSLEREVAIARGALWRVGRAMSWQLYEGLRGKLYYGLGGEGAPAVRAIQLLLRLWGRLRGRPDARSTPAGAVVPRRDEPIELPRSEDPEVSIVIPVYSGAELTRTCLASIRDNTSQVSYEVILVDDGADEPTKRLLESVQGARIIPNAVNLGYLRSVNLGASHASGDWLVLCNNDIVVCEGWLDAMLDCAKSTEDIGVVTPKYLYPDGRVSEAGGIIWKDGTGVNYGRFDPAGDCHYEFRREADYGSAAALLVKRSLWLDVGGFDERFVPMYYEDTDFCFEARERGMRVMYEPRAQVIHREGATAGTNIKSGYKRHQKINRPKFVEKWSRRLEQDHFAPSQGNRRSAASRDRRCIVLVVDHRVPMWDRDSGGLRMLGMLETLAEFGYRVIYLPDNLHPSQPYTSELQRMGVEVWYGKLDVASELSAVASDVAFALLCRPDPASRWIDLVKRELRGVPIVYDTVDLHWLREARRGPLGNGLGQPKLGALAATLKEMELALIRAADVTLAVSAEECELIKADVSDAVVHVVPNAHELKTEVPPADERSGVLFVGGFEHPPNLEAAVRLVRDVMPLVWRELGGIPVTIVGGSVPSEIRGLASSLVEVTGWVPDVDPLIDAARVMVAPMTYGAGLKGKVTQALAAGLPVVTTPIGAEGLAAVDGENMLIGNDDTEIAERAIRVLSDASLWSRLSTAGQKLAEKRCSYAVMRSRLEALLDELAGARRPAEPVSLQLR